MAARLSMTTNNGTGLGNATAVVSPSQGMFQSIGTGYQSLIRLYDAVDHIEDRLSGKVVASGTDPRKV